MDEAPYNIMVVVTVLKVNVTTECNDMKCFSVVVYIFFVFNYRTVTDL